jgi:hypothetical protein
MLGHPGVLEPTNRAVPRGRPALEQRADLARHACRGPAGGVDLPDASTMGEGFDEDQVRRLGDGVRVTLLGRAASRPEEPTLEDPGIAPEHDHIMDRKQVREMAQVDPPRGACRSEEAVPQSVEVERDRRPPAPSEPPLEGQIPHLHRVVGSREPATDGGFPGPGRPGDRSRPKSSIAHARPDPALARPAKGYTQRGDRGGTGPRPGERTMFDWRRSLKRPFYGALVPAGRRGPDRWRIES